VTVHALTAAGFVDLYLGSCLGLKSALKTGAAKELRGDERTGDAADAPASLTPKLKEANRSRIRCKKSAKLRRTKILASGRLTE
jgi:hypothetical protein